MYPHSLNPTNVTEGGVPLTSRWGKAFLGTKLSGPLTVLPHQNLMYAGRYGVSQNPHTTRQILPYISNGYGGPVNLGPNERPTKV